MSRLLRPKSFLLLAFALSYVLLWLWAFQETRIGLRLAVMRWMGLGSQPAAYVDEFVSVADYDPQTLLVGELTDLGPPQRSIEIHGHVFRTAPEEVEQNRKDLQIEYFVNLALRTTTRTELEALRQKFSDPRTLHFPGLNFKHLSEADFGQRMAQDLEEMVQSGGVKGIKVWKNLGLLEKTADGRRLALDDPRLDPVWEVCERHGLIVAIHTADPPAFWQAADGRNERLPELLRFPERAIAADVLFPFADLLAERERLFQRHPRIRFVAQHFGELAHDLEKAALLLDRNPNVHFDLAQRIDELGRQPRRARAFFLKYQDRLLFGMDGPPEPEKMMIYRRFLETQDEYFDYHAPDKPRKSHWKIYGLGLPPAVLEKIYYSNAKKLLGL